MKKILLLVLSLALVLTLAGCKEEEEIIEFEFNIPDEYNVNLNELGYSEYISMSNPTITISVQNVGDIVIQLFPSVAPNTVNSFIKYIQDGTYTNNQFHRVVNGFMIQGGYIDNPSCYVPGEMSGNDVENDLSHTPGVLSMARVGGDYDSGSSQFFIVQQQSTFLDGEYAGFGGVVRGFHLIDYIASLNNPDVNEIPVVPIYIDSITIDLNGYVPEVPICVTEEAE